MKSLQLQLKEGKIRWVILVASFLIAIVALAWVTERAVGLEEQHREDEASARLRERVRLALWRMEAEASQVVVRESLRPALHYEIGEPEPSPLLESAPELVKLHFQCFPAGSTAGLCSPQAPPEASDPESVAEANQRMSDLRQLLRSDTEWEELTGFELLAISGKTGITQIRNRHDDVIPVVATDAWASADQEQREESLITQPIRETRALDQSPASPMKPVWLNEELVLIRRVDDDRGPRMQGVWLDWEALEHRLLRSASDLFPEARLEPIRSTEARDHWRALVSLPLRLEPGPLAISSTRFPAGFATGLGLAWICLLGTFVAISFVLLKTEQLSQRRAAFVSAVTHELRTPMTTFRLYSEMLADDAVTDQADRRHYLNTLCTESDRLMRLIENVLAFSGIENRKSSGRIPIPLNLVEEVEKWFPKLSEQCEAAGLQLEFSASNRSSLQTIESDALSIEQIVSNLIDNAIKYAAPDSSPPVVELTISQNQSETSISVRDYGPGLTKKQLARLFEPFSKAASEAATSAPGIGLGLALCKRLARSINGDIRHESPAGRGARFVLSLRKMS